jgi:type II secretory pathway component PulF
MPTTPLRIEQQVLLCRQVARLVRARMPLIGELASSVQQMAPAASQSAASVETQIAGGQTLASALAGDSSRESQILSACIEAGERADALDRMLELWAEMHIANSRSSKAMLNAMTYPLLLIIVTLLSLGFVIWKIIPEYRATYELFSYEMPGWLEAIVIVREYLGGLMGLLLGLMLLPLVLWFWRRRTLDTHRVPREPARRQRLHALASDVAGYGLAAQLPLNEVVVLSTRAMHAHDSDRERAFERLQHQQPIVPLSRETSIVLASLHAGLIAPQEAAVHLHAVAEHLRQHADLIARRQARWLPMMIALVVGGLTVLTYVCLIYLPWIALLTKIVNPSESRGP